MVIIIVLITSPLQNIFGQIYFIEIQNPKKVHQEFDEKKRSLIQSNRVKHKAITFLKDQKQSHISVI